MQLTRMRRPSGSGGARRGRVAEIAALKRIPLAVRLCSTVSVTRADFRGSRLLQVFKHIRNRRVCRPVDTFPREPADMRRCNHPVARNERIINRRFIFENVQRKACHVTSVQERDHRLLVDQVGSRGIYNEHSLLHPREHSRVNKGCATGSKGQCKLAMSGCSRTVCNEAKRNRLDGWNDGSGTMSYAITSIPNASANSVTSLRQPMSPSVRLASSMPRRRSHPPFFIPNNAVDIALP